MMRTYKALLYSLNGLAACYHTQAAFRLELMLALPMLAYSLWAGFRGVELALMIGSLLMVLMAELVNTGIEAVVDRFSKEYHTLSKRAKDVGSAAVFIALVQVGVVWGIILFYP